MRTPTPLFDRNSRVIETVYQGCRFRSRLEARWAVFFDALAVPWEYEREGFDLGLGPKFGRAWYLPDFWLPEQQCWIEIKGDQPSELETAKAEALALATNFPVYVFFGSLPRPDSISHETDSAFLIEPFDFEDGECVAWDYSHYWGKCPCGRVGIEFQDHDERICQRFGGHLPFDPYPQRSVEDAYRIARGARFEQDHHSSGH